MVTTRAGSQIETEMDVKPNVNDLDNKSRSGKSSCGLKSTKSFTGSTLGLMLGCVGVYALFLTTGSKRLIQGKFIGSHLISVGVGVGGCYIAAFHIFPSSLAICIGAEDEEMYEGYRVWFQNRDDSRMRII